MLEIRYKSTLFEYDGPQIFEARDRIGGHYIAVAVEDNGTDNQYLVVGTEVEKLRKLRTGEIDLRSLLVESSRYGWYLTVSGENLDDSVSLKPQQGGLLQSEYLPESDFFLHDRLATDTLISEARARDNLVVEIVTEPPETETGHRIRASTLSELLKHFQSLVFQACLDEFEEHKPHQMQKLKQLTELDVVIPAAAGSFRMLLESSRSKDLFGVNAELVSALSIVDNLFASIVNVHEQLMPTRKLHRTLVRFDKLLNFLNRNDANLNYAWAEPNFERPRCSSMSANRIRSYIATRQKHSEPSIQEVTLVGEIERVNRKMKTWGLYTGDGQILTGVVDEDGHNLNGLIVGEQYEFICSKEISEEEDANAKYVMKNYKQTTDR